MRSIRDRKSPSPHKEILAQCEKSHSVRANVGMGTHILSFNHNEYKSYNEAEAALLVAKFCVGRALVLSPDNYGATLVMGVISLAAAKAALYYRKFYEIFKKKQQAEAAVEYLERAKGMLGRAYMLRSGQVEPLYYLAEVAVLEGDFDRASRYLSYLEEVNYKPLDVEALRTRIQELQVDGALAKYLARRPPVPSIPDPRNQHVIGGKKFRVGFLSFGDGPSEQAIPAMLLTELQQTGRFQVFEGGGIRVDGQASAALTEASAGTLVDGYVSGTVTKISSSEICFEMRLSNAMSHYVLYAQSVCSPVESRKPEILLPKREKLVALAQDIARSVKEIQAGAIIGVDDGVVYIDVGTSGGVIPGMVGYVLGTGSSVGDESMTKSVIEYTGAQRLVGEAGRGGGDFIVGGVYIISVEEEFSIGVFYREGVSAEEQKDPYAIPGDSVYFK